MSFFKFALSLIITLALIYFLDNRWVIGGNPLPPLGKFLDPFHGFWQNIEPASFEEKALLTVDIRDQVTVIYDSLDIPHIFAKNDKDLYFAQGYVTAAHRLWQMEFQTHAAAGRVSEITGPGTDNAILNYDRGQRRRGMVYAAKNALKVLNSNPTSRMMAEQYTAGVNAFIATLDYKSLPFEYKLLNYAPEPWTPLKCALLLKSMAQTLNMGDKDLEMTNALALYGKDIVDLLYPDRDTREDPIVARPGEWKFKSVIPDNTPFALPDQLSRSASDRPQSDPTTGSNNWAVSGDRTATGSPILCGDPHLNLNLPSLWYVIHLNAPDINTMGASLPGTPTVIIGFNDSIAWSVTNAQRDLVDWFRITYQDATQEKYLLDGQWADTRKVVEAFKVRDAEILYDTVIYTHWGPIAYDENFHPEDGLKHHAFRWISHDGSNEFRTFFQLNRASNYDEFMKALDFYESPAQNFVFASVSNDIAMRIQGRFPARRKEEGKFLLDGSKSSNGWQAFIPNEQNIMEKNPARGFVSSANQFPVDDSYPYYITGTSFESYRNRRINQVLSSSSSVGPADMMALQNDNYSLRAAEILPLLLAKLDSASLKDEESTAYQVLKSWDLKNDKTSVGASYFEAWWENIMVLTWDEMARSESKLSRPTGKRTVDLIRNQPDLEFFDIVSTEEKEDAAAVIRKAFSLAVEDIVKWKIVHSHGVDSSNIAPYWADYKDSYLGHLMRVPALNIHIRAGGGRDIVNAHSRTHGPSWRMIVSLEKSGVRAWATYPGGQSGDPGNAHYVDMLDRWVNGQYFSLHFPKQITDTNNYTARTLSLHPSQSEQ